MSCGGEDGRHHGIVVGMGRSNGGRDWVGGAINRPGAVDPVPVFIDFFRDLDYRTKE